MRSAPPDKLNRPRRHALRGGGRFAVAIVSLALRAVVADEPVVYEVSFESAVHHEATIQATFAGLDRGPLELRMSRSSPGRYALHEFAKNVYALRATDGAGRPLEVFRRDPHGWRVAGHDGTVKVTYTLFGRRVDGTYTAVDETHAHLNAPATYVWARGLEKRPVVVRFRVPPGRRWRAATQLPRGEDEWTFRAPDLAYLMDSPVELSDFTLRSWELSSGGMTATIRLAVHHDGTEKEVDLYAELAKAVVHEAVAIFGELPAFDHGEYTFIADYLPRASGDGMEHRNSTIITSTRTLESGALENLGTLAHEFLHAWNVERLRPRSLEPFDFERANPSGELWFAEGFTSYYTDLTLRRARLLSLERYAERIGSAVDTVVNSPGRRYFSAVGMSLQAPFFDGAESVEPTNRRNTYISYYTYGEAVALGLDLTLRTRPGKPGLDDYMRALWKAHGRDEIPYTPGDLERILADVAGSREFAASFFARYVRGREVVDYTSLLARAGLLLRDTHEGKATLGRTRLRFEASGVVVASVPLVGSPLRAAGLAEGDRIVAIDERQIVRSEDLESVLEGHGPGDAVAVRFVRRGKPRESRITFTPQPRLEIVPFEHTGREVPEDVRAFRDSWLGPRAAERYRLPAKECPTCRREWPFEHEFCPFDGEELGLPR